MKINNIKRVVLLVIIYASTTQCSQTLQVGGIEATTLFPKALQLDVQAGIVNGSGRTVDLKGLKPILAINWTDEGLGLRIGNIIAPNTSSIKGKLTACDSTLGNVKVTGDTCTLGDTQVKKLTMTAAKAQVFLVGQKTNVDTIDFTGTSFFKPGVVSLEYGAKVGSIKNGHLKDDFALRLKNSITVRNVAGIGVAAALVVAARQLWLRYYSEKKSEANRGNIKSSSL